MNAMLGLPLSDQLRMPHHPHCLVDALPSLLKAMEHPMRLALTIHWFAWDSSAVRNVRGGSYLEHFELVARAFGIVEDVEAFSVDKPARLPAFVEL